MLGCPALPGKYLLVKDPNKPQLRIYSVPAEEAIDTQVGVGSLGAAGGGWAGGVGRVGGVVLGAPRELLF